jgi:hypothetical protein
VLLHKFNALPDEFRSQILYSTLYSWDKRDVTQIIGCNSIADSDVNLLKQIATNKKLRMAAKALYFLFSMVSKLFQSAENKAELLRVNKSVIIDIIKKVKTVIGTKRVLRLIGLSPNQFYYWIETKKCHQSLLDLCRKRNPHQMLESEVKVIKDYLLNDQFRNWSSLSIYYQALRDRAVYMGKGTWYKYARRLGIKRKFYRIKSKKQVGIRATSPLLILHMDVTIFKPIDNSRIYIYLLVDNFSRSILNWKADIRFSSSIALSVLKKFTDRYGIKPQTQLITDGGPENGGEVSRFISSNDDIVKLIAQKDIIQSNSMVEAVNKHIKYYYLFKKDLKNYGEISF